MKNTSTYSDRHFWFLRGIEEEEQLGNRIARPTHDTWGTLSDAHNPWGTAADMRDAPSSIAYSNGFHFFTSGHAERLGQLRWKSALYHIEKGKAPAHTFHRNEKGRHLAVVTAYQGHIYALDIRNRELLRFRWNANQNFASVTPEPFRLPRSCVLTSSSRIAVWENSGQLRAVLWNTESKGAIFLVRDKEKLIECAPRVMLLSRGNQLRIGEIEIGDVLVHPSREAVIISVRGTGAVYSVYTESFEGREASIAPPYSGEDAAVAFKNPDSLAMFVAEDATDRLEKLVTDGVHLSIRDHELLVCVDTAAHLAYTVETRKQNHRVLPLVGYLEDKFLSDNNLLSNRKGSFPFQRVTAASDGTLLFWSPGELSASILWPLSLDRPIPEDEFRCT